MNEPTVSVVVVSRGRPAALKRCLIGISQLQYSQFEVVVVSDPEGIEAAEGLNFSDHIKTLTFDEANISAARNLGITHSAGEVVAFIDDDAVPEPQWLRHLVAPAEHSSVGAMGGYVRGRNGISFQWRARGLNPLGEAHPLDIDPEHASVLTPPKGRAIKTEGTNMAIKRDVLIALAGFDTAFHYFLDETDLNMRLGRAGYATAIVPLAEVHHGFEANNTRSSARVPRDLFDIGASWAVFQRKHVAKEDRKPQWLRVRSEQRNRVLRHMVQGGLEPRDVRRLMKRLDTGYQEGLDRPIGAARLATHPASPFAPFPSETRSSAVIPSRPIRFRADCARAGEQVRKGEVITVISLSFSALFHRVRFDEAGYWVQQGGLFGKANRKEPFFRLSTRRRRIQKERRRVARQRGLSEGQL